MLRIRLLREPVMSWATLRAGLCHLVCTGMLLAIQAQTWAHFAWILLPEGKSRQFSVVFSEGLRPDNPEYLAKLAECQVTIHGPEGHRTAVDLTLVGDRLVGQIPEGFDAIALEVPVTWGVMARGGDPFLLKYRALGVLDLARLTQVKFDMTEAAGPLLRVTSEGRNLRIRATVGQSPLAAATIKVVDGGAGQALETTSQGWAAWTPSEAGDFGMYAKASSAESGQLDGQAYQEVRTYVTLAVRIDSARGESAAETAAVTRLSAQELQKSIPELPYGITSFGAARIGDAIYVYGGHTGTAHSYWNTSQSNQLLRWNLGDSAGSWEVVAEGTHRLQGLAMVAHGERLILVGGFFAKNEEGEPHQLFSQDQVAVFDTRSGQWGELPPLPQGRSSHDAIVMDNHLYVVGGWLMNGPNDTQWHETALVMDLTAPDKGWSELPAPGFQRRALALAANEGKIFALGGMERTGGPTRKTSVFDPQSGTWADGPELVGSQGMVGFGASAWPVEGRLVVTAYDGSVQVLNADHSSWLSIGQTEDARFFHRLLPYAPGHLVLVGGANMDSGKFVQPEVIRIERVADLPSK